MFCTFVPCHNTMNRMRVASRVTGLGPVACANSGVLAMAFGPVTCNRKRRMSKFTEPSVQLKAAMVTVLKRDASSVNRDCG